MGTFYTACLWLTDRVHLSTEIFVVLDLALVHGQNVNNS